MDGLVQIIVRPDCNKFRIFVTCQIIEEYRCAGSDGRDPNDTFEVCLEEEYFEVKRKDLYYIGEHIAWRSYPNFDRGNWGLRWRNSQWEDDIPFDMVESNR